eukprot:TRINITY_DN1970_c0_g1_i2.p1 TRINITY_DN1970_c0_g1~~TRINITY_DN1970_c0_g1_i2.p1  ORF type:complete len:697 (+),score=197.25 TRINITY_DN1970_c0_g1_i2:117-2093(+)
MKNEEEEAEQSTSKLIIGLVTLFVLFLLGASILSIYRGGAVLVPGVHPKTYTKGQPVELLVNKVTTVKGPIPFRYHDLPVCRPAEITSVGETLGQLLTANRIETSAYVLKFKEDDSCRQLCDSFDMDGEAQAKVADLIEDLYQVHWQLDELPIASRQDEHYVFGFPLGSVQGKKESQKKFYYNNHVDITIHYSKHVPVARSGPIDDVASDNLYNIVMFEVNPFSRNYDSKGFQAQCRSAAGKTQAEAANKVGLFEMKPVDGATKKAIFTYSVKWQLSTTLWQNRWEDYLEKANQQVHWFAIINAVMIVLFLSGMVAMIMTRILHRDFKRYSEQDPDDIDEGGWKLVSRDVFRPPAWRLFFSIVVGSGAQVLLMAFFTAVIAVLGFISPSNVGFLVTAVLVLYVWMGMFAGYASTRIYQYLGGKRLTRNVFFTAIFFPGVIFSIAFFLNFFLIAKDSSGAFPFLTFLSVLGLWIFISIPLTFVGSRVALRREPISVPVPFNIIPRQIPPQPWYLGSVPSVLMGGILPFGAIFIELYFIFSSIWLHGVYYMFGFLFLVMVILVITCAEIAVVMVYFQLATEDWHWWWRSFLTPGASAGYMLVYSAYYYHYNLNIDELVPTILYFGYTIIMCLFFFVMTGAVGFYASHWFVRKIYTEVRQD